MGNVRRGVCVVVVAGALAAPAHAQVVSPEVRHTGTAPTGYEVTIRFVDPSASSVRIKGEWYFSSAAESSAVPPVSPGRLPSQWRPGDFPMPFPNSFAPNWPVNDLVKDANGVWTFTTPLPPGTFTYALYRNCTAAPPNLTGCTPLSDPLNPPWNQGKGTVEPTSQVYVPTDSAFGGTDHSWQAPISPAGALDVVTYPPSARPLGVYLPPGYDRNRALPYPLMVIHHGGGGHEAHWLTQGVANRILDNVLASGRMQPAVVIFPNINQTQFTDLTDNVLPFVRANYNVSSRPNDTAVGGLSLGGLRTNELLFNRTADFGYYGVWSTAGGVPAATSPLWQNPALKSRLAIHTSVGLQDVLVNTTLTEQSRLAANGIPHVVDNFDGGHEWHVWRLNLRDFASKVAFRSTRVELTAGAGTITATVVPETNQAAVPTGTVQLVGGQPVALAGGKATLRVPNATAPVKVAYSGDALYNASTGTIAYAATSADTPVGATVPATLSLTLGPAANFGALLPGVPNDYTATTTANVISTAGDAALSVSEPGHLANGAFTLPQPLRVEIAPYAWSGPVSNATSTITFRQAVGATDALRTGAYSRTLTFTLSTTSP
jgi:enterochelin esterase-like enzyme